MELLLPRLRREPRRSVSRGTGTGARAKQARAWLPAWLSGHGLAVRVLLCAPLTVGLFGGGWLWLRDSSLVSVRHVHITGVQGTDGVQIRTALDDAARRMTTLDFNVAALRSAVRQLPLVGALRVSTSFPHTVRISVTERAPVAELVSAGQRTAVAADGTVLGPALLSSSLPMISGSVEPSPGARVRESAALAAVAVLGAAPPALARAVARVYNGPEGLTVAMRGGLLVYFGDATRPHAKWLSLARVLVSPSAAGALYVDVRLPERPAAGFSMPSSPQSPSALTPASAQAGIANPTTTRLAESLEAAVGGGTSEASPAVSPSEGSASSASESSTSASESSASDSSETSASSSSAASGSNTTETAESATG